MRRLFALVVVLALLGIGLYYWKYRPAGATPQQALGAVGEKIRGAKTSGEVRAALELNRNLKPYPIDVDVTGDDIVALKGEVPREDFKAEAERLAAAVPGVRQVRNEIRINPALPPPAEGGRTLGENFDDKALDAKIHLAFSLNKDLKGTDLSVSSFKRAVTLSGQVDTPTQRSLAVEIAQRVSGVVSVTDQIGVRGAVPAASPGAPDAGAAARAAETAVRANASLAPYSLTVTAEEGRLVLRGGVKTAAEKDLAALVARDAAGRQVDSQIEIRP